MRVSVSISFLALLSLLSACALENLRIRVGVSAHAPWSLPRSGYSPSLLALFVYLLLISLSSLSTCVLKFLRMRFGLLLHAHWTFHTRVRDYFSLTAIPFPLLCCLLALSLSFAPMRVGISAYVGGKLHFLPCTPSCVPSQIFGHFA